MASWRSFPETIGRRALILALVPLAACGGASWLSHHKAPGYTPPRFSYIHVLVSRQVPDNDVTEEATWAMAYEVLEGLRDRGIRAELVHGNVVPPPPRIELHVQLWEPGNRAERQFSFGGGGKASMVVDCYVVPGPGPEPSFRGRVRGLLGGGQFGGDAIDAARQAGRRIAKAISER